MKMQIIKSDSQLELTPAEDELPEEADIIIEIINDKIVHIKDENIIIVRRGISKSMESVFSEMDIQTQNLLTCTSFKFNDRDEFKQALVLLQSKGYIKITDTNQTQI